MQQRAFLNVENHFILCEFQCKLQMLKFTTNQISLFPENPRTFFEKYSENISSTSLNKHLFWVTYVYSPTGSCSCFFAAREAFLKFNNEIRYRWLIVDSMMLSWKENLEIRQLSEKTLKNASSALLILTLDYEVYFVRQYSLSLIIWNLTIHFHCCVLESYI